MVPLGDDPKNDLSGFREIERGHSSHENVSPNDDAGSKVQIIQSEPGMEM
jgi:hypothetical protein